MYSYVESSWSVMAHGDARKGKWRGNWWMEWVASTLHTTSEHDVSNSTTVDAHTSAVSSRLNWRPANLNGLVRFAERRNLVCARVPSHFKWPLQLVKDYCRLCRIGLYISTVVNVSFSKIHFIPADSGKEFTCWLSDWLTYLLIYLLTYLLHGARYSKAKLKSNGDKASPCFKPFLIGNISDKYLPTRTLL